MSLRSQESADSAADKKRKRPEPQRSSPGREVTVSSSWRGGFYHGHLAAHFRPAVSNSRTRTVSLEPSSVRGAGVIGAFSFAQKETGRPAGRSHLAETSRARSSHKTKRRGLVADRQRNSRGAHAVQT